eukprot:TRINITY_DN3687_c0_g1_i10.p2 TRINITY_DN3687_c0_g1~~TRINITY_DN3687_c0_g1_i10.p2  ORF type:complete len:165 (+),score=34.66 TRINITY_DN3687_c0_g1_i10:237-731(+)
MTLLHVASYYGKTKCAELLIKLGANISVKTEAYWDDKEKWILLDAEEIARKRKHKTLVKVIEAVKQTDFIKSLIKELNSEMCQTKEANKLLETELKKLNTEMNQVKKINTILETRLSELKSEMIEVKKKDTSLLEKSLKDTNTKMDKMEKDMFELKNNEGEKRE